VKGVEGLVTAGKSGTVEDGVGTRIKKREFDKQLKASVDSHGNRSRERSESEKAALKEKIKAEVVAEVKRRSLEKQKKTPRLNISEWMTSLGVSPNNVVRDQKVKTLNSSRLNSSQNPVQVHNSRFSTQIFHTDLSMDNPSSAGREASDLNSNEPLINETKKLNEFNNGNFKGYLFGDNPSTIQLAFSNHLKRKALNVQSESRITPRIGTQTESEEIGSSSKIPLQEYNLPKQQVKIALAPTLTTGQQQPRNNFLASALFSTSAMPESSLQTQVAALRRERDQLKLDLQTLTSITKRSEREVEELVQAINRTNEEVKSLREMLKISEMQRQTEMATTKSWREEAEAQTKEILRKDEQIASLMRAIDRIEGLVTAAAAQRRHYSQSQSRGDSPLASHQYLTTNTGESQSNPPESLLDKISTGCRDEGIDAKLVSIENGINHLVEYNNMQAMDTTPRELMANGRRALKLWRNNRIDVGASNDSFQGKDGSPTNKDDFDTHTFGGSERGTHGVDNSSPRELNNLCESPYFGNEHRSHVKEPNIKGSRLFLRVDSLPTVIEELSSNNTHSYNQMPGFHNPSSEHGINLHQINDRTRDNDPINFTNSELKIIPTTSNVEPTVQLKIPGLRGLPK